MNLELSVELLKEASEKDYYSYFAYIMERGLKYRKSFYLWLISNMYEIFDKDFSVLEEMISKYKGIKETYPEEHIIADALNEYFKDEYSYGDCIAMGLVANAFISYKMNMLDSDVYYEIRDMFVPFNLPISIEVVSIQPIFDLIKQKNCNKLLLLSNIGKSVETEVTDDLFVLALDELNFQPED